jgi:hypothetical protein
MVEIKPEEIAPAVEAVENALREERSTFTIGRPRYPRPSRRAPQRHLAAIVEAAHDGAENEVQPPPVATQRSIPAGARQSRRRSLPRSRRHRGAPPPHRQHFRKRTDHAQAARSGLQQAVACWRAWDAVALLADDMGLGKTFQALAFLAWLRTEQPSPKPVLIVAPTGLLANWKREIEQHLAPGALGPVVSAYGAGLNRSREEAPRYRAWPGGDRRRCVEPGRHRAHHLRDDAGLSSEFRPPALRSDHL